MRWSSEYVLMAAGTIVVAAFLGLWQFFEKRARRPDTDPADWAAVLSAAGLETLGGIGMMCLLAVGIFSAGRWDAAHTPDSARDLTRVLTTFGLLVLILGLLALALFDAMATFQYARRQHFVTSHANMPRSCARSFAAWVPATRVPDRETKHGAAEG